MIDTLRTLRRNAAMFPRLAKLVALVYVTFTLILWFVLVATGRTVAHAAEYAVGVLLVVIAADIATFMAVRRSPRLYAAAQRVADALVTEDYRDEYEAADRYEPEDDFDEPEDEEEPEN